MICSPKTGPFIMRKFCSDENIWQGGFSQCSGPDLPASRLHLPYLFPARSGSWAPGSRSPIWQTRSGSRRWPRPPRPSPRPGADRPPRSLPWDRCRNRDLTGVAHSDKTLFTRLNLLMMKNYFLATVENEFDSRLRQECFTAHWFFRRECSRKAPVLASPPGKKIL